MSSTGKNSQSVTRRVAIAFVAMLAVLMGAAVVAQDDVVREGYFEVRSAASGLTDGVHLLDARLQLVLSNEALAKVPLQETAKL